MDIFRNNAYSRNSAVAYAKKYALHPNPNYKYFPLINNSSGDCANFCSQCLFAGGAPMTFAPYEAWWYDVNTSTWSISWSVAHSLYWFLKINFESKGYGPKGEEIDDWSKLDLGDLIFFEDSNRIIFHSSIVTSFFKDQPLISQHSFEALNISPLKSWDAYKLHFIKISI